MKRFFQKQPLRVKIMAGNLLLLVMFLCPSIMFYSQAMEETIDSNINYMNQINSQLNLNVEMIFSPLDRINYLHYSDGEMRRILVSDSAKKTSAQRFEDDLYLRNALNHSFRSSAFILRGGCDQQIRGCLLQYQLRYGQLPGIRGKADGRVYLGGTE